MRSGHTSRDDGNVGASHFQNVKSTCNSNVATSNPGLGVHLT